MSRATAHAQSTTEPTLIAAPAGSRLVLGGLTLLAAALRLPFLGTQSFWFDETYSVHVVGARSLGQLWDRIGATESTPPLYYVLTWGWSHLVGDRGEATMRTVSALAVIAAVPVAYLALQRLTGRVSALATAALIAVSPLLGWYALDARAYGLLVLVGLLSVWGFAATLEHPSPRRLALWALAATAAIWTHWFAGFLVLGVVVALLWLAPAARRCVLVAGGAALLALVPLLPLLHDQTGDDRAAFIGDDGLADRIEQLVRQFAAGPNVPRTWLEAVSLALALAALTAGTAMVVRRASAASCPEVAERPQGRTLRLIDSRAGARGLLAILAVSASVPLLLAASGVYDRFNVRNVLFLLPLALALAAPALLRLRALPLASLLVLGIATSVWIQSDWRYGNADWRGAIARIDADPSRPVIAVTLLGQPVAALYRGDAASTMPIATRRAWLVVEPARVPGQRALHPMDAPLIASLLADFPSHREQQLHGFRLIALDSPDAVTLDPAALSGATLLAQPSEPPLR